MFRNCSQPSFLLSGILLLLLAGIGGSWVRSQQHQYRLNRRLIAALEKRDTRLALLLINAGADPNTPYEPDPVITPVQLWNHLLHHTPLPVNYSDPALTFAIQNEDSPEVICLLIEHGAKADTKDLIGCTPLIWAIMGGASPEVVRLLLAYGASANARDMNGDTPLKEAIEQEASPQVLHLLLAHGADVNARQWGDRTPLMDAIHSDSAPTTVRLLLQYGADVNAKDEDGRTALDFALVGYFNVDDNADKDIIRQLLAHGANPNVSDKYVETPLMEAQGSPDLVALLKQAGARK